VSWFSFVKADSILMVVILGGFALTCWYMASEVISFKALKALDLAMLLGAKELYKKLHSVAKPLLLVKAAIYRKK
jgi:hypothetical protein